MDKNSNSNRNYRRNRSKWTRSTPSSSVRAQTSVAPINAHEQQFPPSRERNTSRELHNPYTPNTQPSSSNSGLIPTYSDAGPTYKLRQCVGNVAIQCPKGPQSILKTLLETKNGNYNRIFHLLNSRNYNNYSNSNSNTNRSSRNLSRSASPRRNYPQPL